MSGWKATCNCTAQVPNWCYTILSWAGTTHVYLWALIAQATCSLVPSSSKKNSWVGSCMEKCFNYPHVNVPASEFLKLAKSLLLPFHPCFNFTKIQQDKLRWTFPANITDEERYITKGDKQTDQCVQRLLSKYLPSCFTQSSEWNRTTDTWQYWLLFT